MTGGAARVRLAPLALQDLDQIWDYIAVDNLSAADRTIDLILEKSMMLADHPNIGRRRDDIAAAVCSFPVGRYLIFYRPTNQGIEIARILHGSRDISALFKP